MEGLAAFKVEGFESHPDVAWAEGMQMSIPESFMQEGRFRPPAHSKSEFVLSMREKAIYTDKMPVSSRLPFSYQMIPSPMRSLFASVLGRWQRTRVSTWASYPSFPLDLSADFLGDVCGEVPSPFKNGKTPVLLSHDLDSLEGLQNSVKYFAPIEASVGATAINYVVPCSWPVDHGLLQELVSAGHEIGVHGFNHSNLTPFLSDTEQKTRLAAALPLIREYQIRGYRAPSLLRTQSLLKNLAGYYSYDSSIPTSGGLFPVPNNGCATARPFKICGIKEIPLSMPRDGSLRFLGYTPSQIFNVWRQCAENISKSGGVVMLLTHCERRFSGNSEMLSLYQDFLSYLKSSPRFEMSSSQKVLQQAFAETDDNLH